MYPWKIDAGGIKNHFNSCSNAQKDGIISTRKKFVYHDFRFYIYPIKVTPALSKSSQISKTTRFGNLKFGIPYVNKQPGASQASKIEAQCPLRTNCYAQANPAGPAPIMATFLPVNSSIGIVTTCFRRSKLVAKASNEPVGTRKSPFLPRTRTHAPSHKRS